MNSHHDTYVAGPLTRVYPRRSPEGTPLLDAAPRDTEHTTINVCGMDFHNISLEECLTFIDERIRQKNPGYIVTPAVDHLCRYHRNDRLMSAYHESTLVLGGGTPILWASRMLGTPIREKFNGADLTRSLCEHAARQGHSIYLLGAEEGVADIASRTLTQLYPGLTIAGTYSPPKSFEHDRELSEDVLQRVREANPDICLVALGCPKQELWMQKNYKASGVPIMLGIGDSLNFVSGRAKRAPRFLRKAGLEWAWRLAKEPRRLAKRYLIDDALFFVLLLSHLRRKRYERLI